MATIQTSNKTTPAEEPKVDPALLAMAVQATSGGPGLSPVALAALENLLISQSEEMARIAATRAQAREDNQRAKRALSADLEKESDALRFKQRHCLHASKRGDTQLGAQFYPGGRFKAICQTCRKTWDSIQDVPPHLMPDQEKIGWVHANGTLPGLSAPRASDVPQVSEVK